MLKVIAPLIAALVIGLGTGCTTTSNAPSDPHLSGQWLLDKGASDDSDAKIAAAISQANAKLKQKLANAGYGQYAPDQTNSGTAGRGHRGGGANGGTSNASSELNGDEFSSTGYIGPDFAELRSHLKQVLTAPRFLSIETQPDSVRLASDKAPARDYPAGEEFTRIDEYGTARIDTKWSGTIFILRARYSNHATVEERYNGDPHVGTLTVTRNLSDPVAGKLAVRAVYRREDVR